MKKKLLSVILLSAVVLAVSGCGKKDDVSDNNGDITNTALLTQQSEELLSGQYGVEIEIEEYGTIALTLDADLAPVSVTNFVNLANDNFYDGLTFHRIMDGFMMQGGDPEGTGMGGSAQNIQGEFAANGVTNTLNHTRGVISMARATDPNSASSQFFIVHEDSTFLDGNYAAFGWVTDGMDIVDTICTSAPVVDNNGTVPAKNQPVIKDVRIIGELGKDALSTKPTLLTPSMLTRDSEGLLSGKHKVEIEIENYGTIALTLDADLAPVTVTNFINLVKDDFYNGITFHRIISGFMIQGGDPQGTGMGGSEQKIQGEFVANGIVNSLSHTRGVISMARTNDPNSASSQFFIMHQDSPHLDGSYAAFGQVTSGIEVVDAICKATPVQDSNGTVAKADQPKIKEIRIVE